jgi:hypothetical protein
MFNFSRPRTRKPSAGRGRLGLEALEDRCVPTNSAAFVGVDAVTQGSWLGHYGGTGYVIQAGSQGILMNLPSQDKFDTSQTSTYTYADATNNLRGLQQPGNATAPRIEAGWFNYVYGTPTTGFDITVKVPGNQVTDPVTPVALYVEDWDGGNRSETIQPLDAISRAPLGPAQTVSNFRDGVYLNWNVKGNVTFHVEKLTGPNAEVSAVFLGGGAAAPTPSGSAAFVQPATTTGGNWQAVGGADGYDVYGAKPNYPSYAKVSTLGDSCGTYTFANPTADPRGLVSPSGGRIAVAQYSTDSFTLDVNIKDGNTHQVTLYAVDWDNVGRSQKFEVIDVNTGKVYDTQYLSSFRDGAYLSWNVSGHVQIRVTSLNAQTCLVQGMFFGGPAQPAGATLSVASLAAGPVATPSSTVATADSPVATTASTVPTTDSTVAATAAPNVSTTNAVTSAPPAATSGVDLVLLDRLFASGKRLKGYDFGPPA